MADTSQPASARAIARRAAYRRRSVSVNRTLGLATALCFCEFKIWVGNYGLSSSAGSSLLEGTLKYRQGDCQRQTTSSLSIVWTSASDVPRCHSRGEDLAKCLDRCRAV